MRTIHSMRQAGAQTPASKESDDDRAWRRVGKGSGYILAAGLFAGTVLFLLDATDALDASPEFHVTGAGPLQDEANFWVAVFAHQHRILWDIIARDTLFPLAFVALIVVSLAVRDRVRSERPEPQLMTAFFVVGGVVAALSDLIYLAGPSTGARPAGRRNRRRGWSASGGRSRS